MVRRLDLEVLWEFHISIFLWPKFSTDLLQSLLYVDPYRLKLSPCLLCEILSDLVDPQPLPTSVTVCFLSTATFCMCDICDIIKGLALEWYYLYIHSWLRPEMSSWILLFPPPHCSLSVSPVSIMCLRAKPSSAVKIWVVLTGLSLFLCQINYKHWVICRSIPCCSSRSTWKAHGMTIRCLLSSFSPLLVLALFISRYTRAHLEGTECITLNNEHWFVVLSRVRLDFLLCKHNYCQPSRALSFSGLNTQIVTTMWPSALFLGTVLKEKPGKKKSLTLFIELHYRV